MKSRRALVTAAAVVFLLEHLIPLGGLVLYPATLLATWVHETGHGLAALGVGGKFERLEIFWDASGRALTAERGGWPVAIVCLAGLLAPPLTGAAILILARGPRRVRAVLLTLSTALLITLALWVRSPVGLVVVPLDAALIGFSAFAWSDRPRMLLAHLIAVVLALDTVGRLLRYVFVDTAMVGGHEQKSDVALIADAVGGHYAIWGLGISAVALALLLLGLRVAWREPDHQVVGR